MGRETWQGIQTARSAGRTPRIPPARSQAPRGPCERTADADLTGDRDELARPADPRAGGHRSGELGGLAFPVVDLWGHREPAEACPMPPPAPKRRQTTQKGGKRRGCNAMGRSAGAAATGAGVNVRFQENNTERERTVKVPVDATGVHVPPADLLRLDLLLREHLDGRGGVSALARCIAVLGCAERGKRSRKGGKLIGVDAV